jgi:predicted ester cyclase
MTNTTMGEAAKAIVRRNTEEVQGKGDFAMFEELFAQDFVDHTPQPGRTADRQGARQLYHVLRAAFPDFHAVIHWQAVDGDLVTTFKTYHGTHKGKFFGIAPTGRKIQFDTVDAMRVRNGQIAEHWGVANLFSLMEQLGALPASIKT